MVCAMCMCGASLLFSFQRTRMPPSNPLAQRTQTNNPGAPRDAVVDRFLLEALFSTLTNVNFDPDRFVTFLAEAQAVKGRAKALYDKSAGSTQAKAGPLKGPAEMDINALQVHI